MEFLAQEGHANAPFWLMQHLELAEVSPRSPVVVLLHELMCLCYLSTGRPGQRAIGDAAQGHLRQVQST